MTGHMNELTQDEGDGIQVGHCVTWSSLPQIGDHFA
nr:MAG TPA: hypothetical protein [Caudoviricetes sp.]